MWAYISATFQNSGKLGTALVSKGPWVLNSFWNLEVQRGWSWAAEACLQGGSNSGFRMSPECETCYFLFCLYLGRGRGGWPIWEPAVWEVLLWVLGRDHCSFTTKCMARPNMKTQHKENFCNLPKTVQLSPSWFGSVDGALACGWRVTDLILVKGTCLSCGLNPQYGAWRRQPINCSLSSLMFLSFYPFPFISPKINKNIFKKIKSCSEL